MLEARKQKGNYLWGYNPANNFLFLRKKIISRNVAVPIIFLFSSGASGILILMFISGVLTIRKEKYS